MPGTILPDRRVLVLGGKDRVGFLDGLVSNSVAEAAPGHAVWAGFLTPQGRYLADFFIFSDGERLFLDCDAGQAEALATKLARFRLRAEVTIAPADLGVTAGWAGTPQPSDPLAAPDPRLPEAGWRALVAMPNEPDEFAAYEAHRIALGLPSPVDCDMEKTLLLEADFDALHGVSFTKGCYMGQEVTARTHYRALLKRRLLPVEGEADLPPFGTPITRDGQNVGELRSVSGTRGLALLRREVWEAVPLLADGVSLRAVLPSWLNMGEPV